MKKILATVLTLCLLLSMTVMGTFAADFTHEFVYDVKKATGTYDVEVLSTVDITVHGFEPSEVGVYNVTTSTEGVTLYVYTGSQWFLVNGGVAEDNIVTIECKEGYVGNTYLYGVAGDVSTATITIALDEDADVSVDINSLPYSEYKTTATLSPFTLPEGDFEYVDVTEEHTAVLGDDGYYHLDSADGEILYVNIGSDAPYISLVDAVSYGQLRCWIYNEDGSFKDKIDYSTCITDYVKVAKNNIYPMTADLVEIMQTVGGYKGWYDYDAELSAYLFADVEIVESTGWLCNACYIPVEDPLGSYTNPYQLICDNMVALSVEVPAGESICVQADNADGTIASVYVVDGNSEAVTEGCFVQYGRFSHYADLSGEFEFEMNTSITTFDFCNTSENSVIAMFRLASPAPSTAGTYESGSEERLPGSGSIDDAYVLTLTNGEAVTYVTEMSGNETDCYVHSFTADADGELTIAINDDSCTAGWQYCIMGSAGQGEGWTDNTCDPVLSSETITVSEGDVIQIIVGTYDAVNWFSYPAGVVEWTALFTEAEDEPVVPDEPATGDEPSDEPVIPDEPATGDEPSDEPVIPDEPTTDEASGDEASGDEASGDEASGDEATPDEYEMGDVDCNGVVNIKDVTAIQKMLVDLIAFDDEQMALADFDQNGTVNIKDATAIQKFLVGLPW